MSGIFKPMLATDFDPTKQRFPVLASAKLDGIRAIVRDGIVYSRSNKPIPNKHVQAKFGWMEFLDGELIVGEPTSETVYRDTVSIVMSDDKPADDVRFYVFDEISNLSANYVQRLHDARLGVGDARAEDRNVYLHDQQPISNHDELVAFEAECLDLGYEGLIIRDPNSPYKQGRSTVKEGYLLKVKRFVDDEAVIVDCFEREHNGNEAVIDELGRTKRSSHKSGKTGRGDLGGFVLRNSEGVEFSCGTGFSDPERATYWASRKTLIGKIAKYKFFPVGVKTAPRHPVWLGFRDPIDM